MALYENEKCPVCSKPFEKGDDIVTCPECGTPHHRECYKDYGGCKNKSLHGTDFIYKRNDAHDHEAKAKEKNDINGYFPPLTDEKVNGESEYYEPDGAAAPPTENSETEKRVDEIDGVKLEDLAAVVAINPLKFLQKFRRNKKLNWNWSAFVFGPFYFFFRKMHVHGAVLLALEYGFRFLISAIFSSALMAVANSLQDVKSMADYYNAAAELINTPEYQQVAAAGMIIIAGIFFIHLISALFADSFYRKKCISVVKAVDEKVNMGESFSLMGPAASMESNMSQKDMRKIFLSRQGGVSTMAPLLAFIIVQLLLSFI